MRVLHVTYSTSGGAGRVCQQLSEALVSLGVESRVFSISDSNIAREPFKNPSQTATALADSLLVGNSLNVGHLSLFRGALNNSRLISEVVGADVVHLHWPAGLISKGSLAAAVQVTPMVWTLHDYWALTGGCHFPGACKNMSKDCAECPISRPLFHRQIEEQRIASKELSSIQFVAPTESARRTAVAIAPWIRNIEVIPNPVKIEFGLASERKSKSTRMTVGLIATNIDDPRKRVQSFLEEYARVTSILQLNSPPKLLIGGSGKRRHDSHLVSYFGRVNDENVGDFYGQIDALVVPSLDETFSLVTVESILRKRPVFAIDSTAQAGIIQSADGGKTFPDLRSLAEGVATYRGGLTVKNASADRLANETLPENVARLYLTTYERAIVDF